MNDNDNDAAKQILIKQVEFYFSRRIKVHVRTLKNRFYNGLISEHDSEHIVVKDKILGEVFITFQEIFKLEPFVEGGKY